MTEPDVAHEAFKAHTRRGAATIATVGAAQSS